MLDTVKEIMKDTTHLMRRYMRTLMPDNLQNDECFPLQ